MITFFHTADVHFGVENYGKIDAKTGIHSRLLDFKRSFDECVDQAVTDEIDLFILSGDAYKTPYPTPTQQKLLAKSLFKLYKAKIPTVIIVGNHDNPLSFGKASALDIFSYIPVDGFYVFAKPGSITIETKNGLVQIVGIPWPTRNTLIAHEKHRFKTPKEVTMYLSEKVGQLIQSFADQLDPNLPSILAGHLTVSSGVFSGSEKCAIFGTDPVLLPSQLSIKPFDYVALGHLHRHQDLNKKGAIPVVYSGSIERIDFGERKEDKGYCRVIIDRNKKEHKKCEYSFVKVATRPMIQFDITLESGKPQTEQILEAIGQQEVKGAIVKVIYRLPKGKKDNVDLFAIQRACLGAQYVVGIIPIHTLEERKQRADLKVDMDFVTMLGRYIDTKSELADKKATLLEKALEIYEEYQERIIAHE